MAGYWNSRGISSLRALVVLLVLSSVGCATAASPQDPVPSDPPAAAPPAYDASLAKRVGADQRGMRPYVLVILKTGPKRVPEGEARNVMFAGHFANIERLAKAGKLVIAGPFSEDPDGWRGLFLFAVEDIEEAKQLTATDPVIVNGEMVAEYHRWYGSAAAMLIPEIHGKLSPKAE
jgi:uncharacterized protein YciI